MAGVVWFLLCAQFVWDVRASTSPFDGRRGVVFFGWAVRVGGARVDVNF